MTTLMLHCGKHNRFMINLSNGYTRSVTSAVKESSMTVKMDTIWNPCCSPNSNELHEPMNHKAIVMLSMDEDECPFRKVEEKPIPKLLLKKTQRVKATDVESIEVK